MMNLIESSAGRIAAKIQGLATHFDAEILSLPGGSIMAVLLWAYAHALRFKGQPRLREGEQPNSSERAVIRHRLCPCTGGP